MPNSLLWHAGPGRHWPLSHSEEQIFLNQLKENIRPGERGRVSRPDVTCLVNALRDGVSLDALLDFLPGVRAANLLACYRKLDSVRMSSAIAWLRICDDPGAWSLTENAQHAGILLPVPVMRLSSVAATALGRETISHAIMEAAAEVSHMGELSLTVEKMLTTHTPPSAEAVTLGSKLHNPYEPAIWGHAYFLADRVGALSPNRVADILGERRLA